MSNICIYPGSFDPVTHGHLDIIKRASMLYDTVHVTILHNVKKSSAFTLDHRLSMLKKSCEGINNVVIGHYDGLLVNYANKIGCKTIIRGLRAVTDFEAEFQMAQINLSIAPNIETLFLSTSPSYSYISSSVVREIASFGGDFANFVPECIINDIKKIYSKQYKEQ